MTRRPGFVKELKAHATVANKQARVLSSRLPAPEVAKWYQVGVDVPFEGDWENYTLPELNPLSYMKDSSGFVHLRGVVSNLTDASQIMFILPAEFRPEYLQQHPCRWSGQSEGETISLYIHIDGRVDVSFGTVQTADWVLLDNHRWKAV